LSASDDASAAADDDDFDDTDTGLDPTEAIELVIVTEIDDESSDAAADEDGPLFSMGDEGDDPTPVGAGFDRLDDATSSSNGSDDFRFTFDDERKS
jgi:hypothetical protein